MAKRVSLTTSEKLDRSKAKEGRSQKWIIARLADLGYPMTEVQFSVKKKNNLFTDEETEALGEILPEFAEY